MANVTIQQVIVMCSPAKLHQAVVSAVNAFAQTVANELKNYPSATEANRPGRFTPDGSPMGFYERGRGEWYPIVRAVNLRSFGNFGKAQGIIKASKTQRETGTVAGYRLIPSSERLRELSSSPAPKEPSPRPDLPWPLRNKQ